jgi:hypothetical protein
MHFTHVFCVAQSSSSAQRYVGQEGKPNLMPRAGSVAHERCINHGAKVTLTSFDDTSSTRSTTYQPPWDGGWLPEGTRAKQYISLCLSWKADPFTLNFAGDAACAINNLHIDT